MQFPYSIEMVSVDAASMPLPTLFEPLSENSVHKLCSDAHVPHTTHDRQIGSTMASSIVACLPSRRPPHVHINALREGKRLNAASFHSFRARSCQPPKVQPSRRKLHQWPESRAEWELSILHVNRKAFQPATVLVWMCTTFYVPSNCSQLQWFKSAKYF